MPLGAVEKWKKGKEGGKKGLKITAGKGMLPDHDEINPDQDRTEKGSIKPLSHQRRC